jgi:predicted enzyme related to lactoylglutathione lyase
MPHFRLHPGVCGQSSLQQLQLTSGLSGVVASRTGGAVAVNIGWPCWVGVVAENLAVQRQFYRDVLGLAELAAGPDWVQFDFGDAGVLELIQRSDEPQYDRARYQVGYAVADIESAAEELMSQGVHQVTAIEGDPRGGGRWCYFRDPEGNTFEIKERGTTENNAE